MAVLDDRDVRAATGKRVHGQPPADGVVVRDENLHFLSLSARSDDFVSPKRGPRRRSRERAGLRMKIVAILRPFSVGARPECARRARKRARVAHRYFPGKNDGSGMSRMVRSPGAAVITCGIELTVIEAVAMSPWMPPCTFQ